MTFFDVVDLYWQWYGWHGHHSFSVPLEFFFQFFLSPISSQITRREKQRKKMIPETYWSSDDDITSIIKNISTRQIQRHQIRSLMMNGVNHMNRSKMSKLTCLWATHVSHFNHSWWSFLVSLYSSHQNLSNGTSDVVIGVSVCL
jgi:hypothetical protein